MACGHFSLACFSLKLFTVDKTSVFETYLGVCLADVILHATLWAELLLAQQAHVLPHGAPCLFGMGLESVSSNEQSPQPKQKRGWKQTPSMLSVLFTLVQFAKWALSPDTLE